MKNLFLLLLATLTLSCCDKDDDKPTNPVDQLPPATHTGANTAGCLVNGQVFISKGYFPGGSGLICNYIDGEDFTLRLSENINNKIRSVFVISYNKPLDENQTYILKEDTSNTAFGTYIINAVASPNPNYYSTTSTITGELKIMHHDFDHAILSGTFWFDAINSEGEKVEIREGRFDMHY